MKLKNKKGFTLVEMLVVIAIIGILMALLFPVFTTVLKKAKIAKAKTEISQIEQAWKAFVMDYKEFPSGFDKESQMTKSVVKHLTGDNEDPNTRGTIYMEIDPDEDYTDPWQNTYNIQLKTSGKQDAYDGEEVNKQVLVWSLGPDEKEDKQDDVKKDDVKNWN
jgi:type IV pilus assembly protein PilA